MERLKTLLLLALVLVGCGSRPPEFWQTYSTTVTAAASMGMGGQPTLTPVPGAALIGAEYNVTQAAINAQSAQTVSDQTRTAYEYAAAIASLEAQQIVATQMAPTLLAQQTTASQQATATVMAQEAANSVTTTLQAIEVAQAQSGATAVALIDLASAQGTATAIAGVAGIEEQARLAQREELAIANQRARNKAILAWVIPLLVAVGVFMVAAALSFRVVVQARPQVIDNRDKDWVIFDHDGQPLLAAPRRTIPASVAESTPEPEPTAHPALTGELVELPDLMSNVLQVGLFDGGRPVHLGPGFMGIQVTGEKGSGKSSLLRLMAAQALVHGWEVFYADAEALTFDPNLWGPVAQSTGDARLLFAWLRDQVFAERHDLFRSAFTFIEQNLRPADQFLVDNLVSYNKAARLFNLPVLKPMLMVWDEANSHLKDKVLQALVENTFRASRKVGCDSVVAGHNWRATDVPPGLKLQLHNAVTMRCNQQDSKLILGNDAAAQIPADSPGMAFIRLKRYQGYMQAYHLPDSRLISMVRGVRPPTDNRQPWVVTRPQPPALPADNEMDMDELFALGDGGDEAEARPRKLDPNDPRLRQRVLQLRQATKADGLPYSQRDIEAIVTGEFCAEAYQGGQAYKVVKEIISGGAAA